MTTVENFMTEAGYKPENMGGGHWWWSKPMPDGSRLCVATIEYSLDGEPAIEEWYAGRHCDGSYVECNEALTLADAMELVERLPSLEPEVQRSLSRHEIETASG